MNATERLTVDIPPKAVQALQTLQKVLGISKAETVRLAIITTAQLQERLRGGRRLMLVEPDGTSKELDFVMLT